MDLKKAIDSLAGTDAEICWIFSREKEAQWSDMVAAFGAIGRPVRRQTVYEFEERDPYVIIAVDVEVQGVRLHAQWSRAATAEEVASSQTHPDRQAIKSSYTATGL